MNSQAAAAMGTEYYHNPCNHDLLYSLTVRAYRKTTLCLYHAKASEKTNEDGRNRLVEEAQLYAETLQRTVPGPDYVSWGSAASDSGLHR